MGIFEAGPPTRWLWERGKQAEDGRKGETHRFVPDMIQVPEQLIPWQGSEATIPLAII